MSPQELARAQGVDSRLTLHVGERAAYQIVGGAVAIEVARALSECLQPLIETNEAWCRLRKWLDLYPDRCTPVGREASDTEVTDDSLRRQMFQRMLLACKSQDTLPLGVVTADRNPNQTVKALDNDMAEKDLENIIHYEKDRVAFAADTTSARERRAQYAEAQERCSWCTYIINFNAY